jgi:uncharacterized protein YutE (UPF0331/DUF86 family)
VTDLPLAMRKLAILREHLARARRRRPDELQVYLDDVDLQDALAMSLMVAIQESIDIAFHIAAEEVFGVPASNAESFEMLARHGVIDAALARRMARAAGMRNRIAHGYASVDVDRLWAELPEGFDAIESYAACIAAFLGRGED